MNNLEKLSDSDLLHLALQSQKVYRGFSVGFLDDMADQLRKAPFDDGQRGILMNAIKAYGAQDEPSWGMS